MTGECKGGMQSRTLLWSVILILVHGNSASERKINSGRIPTRASMARAIKSHRMSRRAAEHRRQALRDSTEKEKKGWYFCRRWIYHERFTLVHWLTDITQFTVPTNLRSFNTLYRVLLVRDRHIWLWPLDERYISDRRGMFALVVISYMRFIHRAWS